MSRWRRARMRPCTRWRVHGASGPKTMARNPPASANRASSSAGRPYRSGVPPVVPPAPWQPAPRRSERARPRGPAPQRARLGVRVLGVEHGGERGRLCERLQPTDRLDDRLDRSDPRRDRHHDVGIHERCDLGERLLREQGVRHERQREGPKRSAVTAHWNHEWPR